MQVMTRRQFVSTTMVGAVASSSSQAAAQPRDSDSSSASLEALITATIAQFPAVPGTGVAVAVIKNRQLSYAGGFGLRDRESGAKVEPETFFAIGSATKSFTSMALAMLAEDGTIQLDAPIKTYLPDFGMKDPQAADATLEDILSHRTGLRPHDALWYLGSFSIYEILHRLRHLNPGQPFRQSFAYSNVLVSLAGLVLKAASGTTWDEFVTTRIFRPLDMRESTFSVLDLPRYGNYAKGYNEAISVNPHSMESIRPAGEINSNVVELAKWMSLHLSRGLVPGGGRIISSASLDKMYASHNPLPGGGWAGLGWLGFQIGPKRLLFHAGNAEGFTSFVSFMPDDGHAVIALTNQHKTKLPQKLAIEVYKHLLISGVLMSEELPRVGPAIPGTPRTATKVRIARQLSHPGSYGGMYSNRGYGDMSVTALGSGLMLTYYRNSWLLEQGAQADEFTFEIESFGGIPREVDLKFHRNDAGHITALSVPFDVTDPDDPSTALPVIFIK